MSAKENADAFLLVIKKLIKWFFIILGFLIIAGFIIYGIYTSVNYFKYELPKSKIEISARFWPEKCPDNQIFLSVMNNSDKTISKFHFYVQARRPGRSTNFAKAYRSYENDRIIKPGDGFGFCYSIEKDSYASTPVYLEDSNYEVKITEFYPDFE